MLSPVRLDEIEEGADAVDAFRDFSMSLLAHQIGQIRTTQRNQNDGQNADAPGELSQNVLLPG